jgi:hypothetical protein
LGDCTVGEILQAAIFFADVAAETMLRESRDDFLSVAEVVDRMKADAEVRGAITMLKKARDAYAAMVACSVILL